MPSFSRVYSTALEFFYPEMKFYSDQLDFHASSRQFSIAKYGDSTPK